MYIDFDNVVISRYDNLHGDGAWRKDEARHHRPDLTSADPVDVKLAQAEVDLGAIIDYAASFGVVAMTRAYADWSVPANAAYKRRSSTARSTWSSCSRRPAPRTAPTSGSPSTPSRTSSNHHDITHVTLVAGDSDYVPLAQRCKRLGRFVVGIGVAGSTSRALVNACDEFQSYEALPGLDPAACSRRPRPPRRRPPRPASPRRRRRRQEDGHAGAGRAGRAGRVRRARRADRGDGPARPRGPGRPAEERRRVGAQLRA